MRRTGPRPLAAALAQVTRSSAPATTLARVQACWEEVAGEAVAGEARPVSEQGGILTLRCESAVWAQELELLSGDLLRRLNEALAGPSGDPPLKALRCRVGGPVGNP